MCLIKTHRFPKISRKPIKCYKVVYKIGNKLYSTEYENYHFLLGDTIKNRYPWIFSIFEPYLEGEVVHAYTNIVICRINIRSTLRLLNKSRSIIECEILPFTPYWLGTDGDICATRIKTIKEVQKE